jgi:hypothetical protein
VARSDGRPTLIMQSFTRSDWGQGFRLAAHFIAPAVVWTFVAGEALGRWLHTLNDDLAVAWRNQLLRPAQQQKPPAPPSPPGPRGGSGNGVAAMAAAGTPEVAWLDWRAHQAVTLRQRGWSQQRIASALGISRWTTRKLLAAGASPQPS